MEGLKGKKAADVDLKKLCETSAQSFLALEITQGFQAVFHCITLFLSWLDLRVPAGYLKD